MSNRFKVLRPNAFSVGTATLSNVIPFESGRSLANEELVGRNKSFAGLKDPIARRDSTDPKRTAIRATRVDMSPESDDGIFNPVKTLAFGRLNIHRKILLLVSRGRTVTRRGLSLFYSKGN